MQPKTKRQAAAVKAAATRALVKAHAHLTDRQLLDLEMEAERRLKAIGDDPAYRGHARTSPDYPAAFRHWLNMRKLYGLRSAKVTREYNERAAKLRAENSARRTA